MPPDEKNSTVKEAVESAVQTEEKTEEKVEETKPKTLEVTKDVEEAIQLYAALQNEDLRPGIIEFLAKKQGLLKDNEQVEDLTRKEQKSLKDRLLSKIPDQYKEVMPWIADLIEEGVTAGVEEKTKDLETRVQTAMEREIRRTTDTEVDNFFSATPDAKNYEKEMAALAKKMPQGEGVEMQEYLDNLYTIASKNATAGKTLKETVDKVNRNAKNDLGKGSESTEKVIKIGSKLPSVKEAVRAAAEGKVYR